VPAFSGRRKTTRSTPGSTTKAISATRTTWMSTAVTVTDAAEHDSRQFDRLLCRGNTSRDVFGDGAYRSAAVARLEACGFRSRISCSRHMRSSTAGSQSGGGKPREEPHPRLHRACFRGAGNGAQRPRRARHWHRPSARQDRPAEPRLQHPAAGYARTYGRRLTTGI
jgi:hypothetical protein